MSPSPTGQNPSLQAGVIAGELVIGLALCLAITLALFWTHRTVVVGGLAAGDLGLVIGSSGLSFGNSLLFLQNGPLALKGQPLQKRDDKKTHSSGRDDPIRVVNRRGWILMGCVVGWAICLVLGVRRIDANNNRLSAGYGYFGVGFALYIGGLLLLLLTDFRSTWSWWL
mgnify:CR=1